MSHATTWTCRSCRCVRDATVRVLRVEEIVRRAPEQLMPPLDRSNRVMQRNMKALKDHR